MAKRKRIKGQKKKRSTKTTQKIKDRATRTPLKTEGKHKTYIRLIRVLHLFGLPKYNESSVVIIIIPWCDCHIVPSLFMRIPLLSVFIKVDTMRSVVVASFTLNTWIWIGELTALAHSEWVSASFLNPLHFDNFLAYSYIYIYTSEN